MYDYILIWNNAMIQGRTQGEMKTWHDFTLCMEESSHFREHNTDVKEQSQ